MLFLLLVGFSFLFVCLFVVFGGKFHRVKLNVDHVYIYGCCTWRLA